MRWIGLLTLVFLAAFGLSACGGGGGGGDDGDDPAEPLEMTLRSEAGRDGYLSSGLGTTASLTSGIDVGDQDGLIDGSFRNGFVSFNPAPLPAGALISRATLRCYHTEMVGSPFFELGRITIDHLDYGEELQPEEIRLMAITPDVAEFTPSSDVGWRSADVTVAVRQTLSTALPRCQFRLRFTLEPPGDGGNDFVTFEDGDGSQGTSNHPMLVIEYTLP